MEQVSSSLEVRHISKGAELTEKYIERRRRGEITSLKTSKPKFNATFMNGID